MQTAAHPSRTQTQLMVNGVLVRPLAQGALWWPDERLLVVSDLHLEKGSSFAARGQMLPPYDSAATLSIIEGLVAEHAPDIVISLGDSFHDRRAETRMSDGCVQRVRALTGAADWVWVEGNHDPDPPAELGGRAARTLRLGPLVFRHEPTGEVGEIAGHLHPAVRIGSAHRTLRRKCFVSDGRRLVMPALGAFTGGLNILDEAFSLAFPEGGQMAFALGQDQVYPVARDRLRPDGGAGHHWRLSRAR